MSDCFLEAVAASHSHDLQPEKTLSPALENFIKFLARIAVEDYLKESKNPDLDQPAPH
jgi:hypothetical protein